MFFKKQADITEEDLVKGCQEGKERYFKMLYEKHYGKMLNVCFRYARDRDEAKDMLQEGFIRVFKSLRQFNFEGSFEGWLRRVMVTTSINYVKRNVLRNIIVAVSSDQEEEAMLSNNDKIIQPAEVLSKLHIEDLHKLIIKLPPVYRMVFNLSVIEGLSHKEISEMLDITESTSRSNLNKARMRLQSMIIHLQNQENRLNYEREATISY